MNVKNFLRVHWDRAGAVACLAVGVICLIVGYTGVSGTRETADQIPYVGSGGMVGLFLLGAGIMLWLSADMRDEWRKLDSIDRHLRAGGAEPEAEAFRNGRVGLEAAPGEPGPAVVAQEISLR